MANVLLGNQSFDGFGIHRQSQMRMNDFIKSPKSNNNVDGNGDVGRRMSRIRNSAGPSQFQSHSHQQFQPATSASASSSNFSRPIKPKERHSTTPTSLQTSPISTRRGHSKTPSWSSGAGLGLPESAGRINFSRPFQSPASGTSSPFELSSFPIPPNPQW